MAFRSSKISKSLVAGAALAILIPVGVVFANPVSVHATANFISNVVLTPTDMQFGNISYNGTPAAGDTVVLGTSGSIAYNGHFSAGGVGTIAAGDVGIAGTVGNALDVACSSTATLAQTSGSGRIDINSIKIANLSVASGGGVACSGLGTPVLTFTLTAGTDDHLKVGGTIDGSTQASFAGGIYSTANTGGADIQVDVVYH